MLGREPDNLTAHCLYALALDPTNHEAMSNLGVALQRQGREKDSTTRRSSGLWILFSPSTRTSLKRCGPTNERAAENLTRFPSAAWGEFSLQSCEEKRLCQAESIFRRSSDGRS